MRRRRLGSAMLAVLGLSLGACVATPEQQAAALSPSRSSIAQRTRQSRRFDTTDRTLMLQAALGALQDLGFTIEESQPAEGVIVGSKLSGATLRAQVSIRETPGMAAMVVRVTFQRIIPRPGAMLALGETLEDPVLYQEFFERLAQSAFLTAHGV